MAPLCKNCGARLEAVYCPSCGQKDLDLERPVFRLLGELLQETFDMDGRAARTLRALLFRPGVLTASFVAGQRRRYTPPVRLYLFVSVTFFLLIPWLASRGVLLELAQDLEADAAGQARFLGEELPRLMFLLLPVFGLILKLAFWQRLYFDHLIFSLHFHSAAYITLALMMPMERVAGQHWLPLVAQLLLLVYLLAHLAIALRRVYLERWLRILLKSTAILLGYVSLLAIVMENSGSLLIVSD